MTILLLISTLALAAFAAVLAMRLSRLATELTHTRGERDGACLERDELSERVTELRGVQQELAAKSARLEAVEAERDRMLGKDGERAEETSKHIANVRDAVEALRGEVLPQILNHSQKAASGAERVESGMTSWMRRIANPQSRGAFGELAVENQLKSLGLEPGRDYMRQVAGADGKLRPDFVVRAGSANVVIDAKFALDDDLAGIDEAIDAEDSERLIAYGRKLKMRAEDLAKRDYAKIAEDRGTATVLLYVPVEGAHEALCALPNFSLEKFCQRHRVYVVTPSQLGLALGFVAAVAHDARRNEETERVAENLLDAAEDMANMVDQLDQHGKHLQTAFTSYDKLVGMTGTRSNLWRRVSTVFEFARRTPSTDGDVRRINPPRDDAGENAERWREAAAENG